MNPTGRRREQGAVVALASCSRPLAREVSHGLAVC